MLTRASIVIICMFAIYEGNNIVFAGSLSMIGFIVLYDVIVRVGVDGFMIPVTLLAFAAGTSLRNFVEYLI